MSKLLLICRPDWYDLNHEHFHLYSLVHFLTQRFNIELIIHDPYEQISEQIETHDIIGTIFSYPRYFSEEDMNRIAREIYERIGPQKPFLTIRNFLGSTPPPADFTMYDPGGEPVPEWLRPHFDAHKPIDISSPHLGLDPQRYVHYSEDVYQQALDKAMKLPQEDIGSALWQSRWDGTGLGPDINTFLIEADQLLALINEPHGSHQVLHHTMHFFLPHHNETLAINGIARQNPQLVNGWVYRKTGAIELPVLDLAASSEDWNSVTFGPALRRVVSWAHAQRQVIPILSRMNVLTPE